MSPIQGNTTVFLGEAIDRAAEALGGAIVVTARADIGEPNMALCISAMLSNRRLGCKDMAFITALPTERLMPDARRRKGTRLTGFMTRSDSAGGGSPTSA